MARFERVNLSGPEWDKVLSEFPDRIVYQSSAWLSFLAESQNGELVIAALKEGNEIVGYFTGMIVRKFGLKILGSPFRAWTCPYIGFNLRPSVPRRAAIEALPDFAFKQLGCIHLEIVDSYLKEEDIAGLGLPYQMNATFIVDLAQTEEGILAKMNSYRRRDIRRAEKHGVRIEEVNDPEFADEFSNQLKDVFAKQGLVPTFGADRVRMLLKHLLPTGTLLCVRAYDPEGHRIASGLYLGMGSAAFYWGGASWRQYQNLHPNEALQWYAMKYWKQRGMKTYNLVGTMDFKARFGGQSVAMPLIRKSKYRWVSFLRNSAPRILRIGSALKWKLKGGKGNANQSAAATMEN
jgi:hypothetical protein